MRFGKYRSDEKILHDEYFSDQPSAAFLLTARLVLLCLMSASFVTIFCDLYGYEGMGYIPAAVAAAASGALYILASVLPAPIIYGAVAAAIAGIGWVLREKVILLSTYLWDYLLMKLDSRLLHTTEYLIHSPAHTINAGPADIKIMHTAFFWAAILVAVICALFFAAAVRTRFRFSIPALAVTIISVPAIAAETAAFLPSYIAFVVCIFGFTAISSSYDLDLGFIYGSVTAARLNRMRADREYHHRTRLLVFGKKIVSDTDRYHRYSGNMIAMTIVAAIVFSGASWLIPDGKGLDYRKILDTVTTMTNEAANTIGDIFGITFGKADDRGYFSSDNYGEISENISLAPPSDSDRPVLEVALSRDDIPVYLRGDIGVDYIGGAWTSVSSVADKYDSAVDPYFCPEAEYQVFRRYLAWRNFSFSPDDILPLQIVSLKYMRNTRVVFQPVAPYELTYKKNDKYDYYADFILRTKNGFVKTFDSLALTPDMEYELFGDGMLVGLVGNNDVYSSLASGYISAPDMSTEDYVRNINAYRAFIDETYKTASGRPEIKPFCDEIAKQLTRNTSPGGFSDNTERYNTARAICNYFKDNFTYSLEPQGEGDMLDTFLNDTHRGHCALFATAMTLTLREYGIPARYVTGYAAYPGGEQDKDGNFRQTLAERQLHAWVEVYFREIGWLPFDPTAEVPGYGGNALIPAEPEVTESTSGTDTEITEPEPPETSASEAETTVPPDEPPADTSAPAPARTEPVHEKKDLWVRLLPIIVIMAVILALAVVTVLFFRNLSAAEKRAIKSFRTLPPTEATVIMYRFTLALLEKKGLVPGNEQFYDFAERVDGSIELKGLNYFLMDVMPVFEKAEFGDPKTAPVSEDEREAVYRYTAAVYAKVMSDASSMKRLSMKISLFL